MTLDQLAIKHQTDKSSLHHNYCNTYEQYFAPYKGAVIKFVELGYGGYEYHDRGGQGLRMWRDYFTKANIHCIELYQKTNIPAGCNFHCMSQVDERVACICNGAMIVVDDASHINPLTLHTFQLVWPVLAPGGIYVIEDVETSYGTHDNWASGAPLADYNHPTAINLCRSLVDNVNSQYSGADDMQIESIHFHKNIVFIKKK